LLFFDHFESFCVIAFFYLFHHLESTFGLMTLIIGLNRSRNGYPRVKFIDIHTLPIMILGIHYLTVIYDSIRNKMVNIYVCVFYVNIEIHKYHIVLKKPLDFLSMSPHTRVSKSAMSYACRVQNLHHEVTKKI